MADVEIGANVRSLKDTCSMGEREPDHIRSQGFPTSSASASPLPQVHLSCNRRPAGELPVAEYQDWQISSQRIDV